MQCTTKGSLRLCVCLWSSWLVSPFASSPLFPRVQTVGSMIHFARRKKKKKEESACERRNRQDRWEIIRWSSVVDLELNGIINQAKKQARCSYIYYLHFFHFRRCNQQTYTSGPLIRVTGTWRPSAHFDHWPWKRKVGSVLLSTLFFSSTQCPLPPSNLYKKQNKSRRITFLCPCPLN